MALAACAPPGGDRARGADSVPTIEPGPRARRPSRPSPRPQTDTGLPADQGGLVGEDGPWAHAPWRAWRDTASPQELLDTAFRDLAAPLHPWPPALTWEFAVEGLERRAGAGDRRAVVELLAVLLDTAVTDSLSQRVGLARAVSVVFEANPELFAQGYAGLPQGAADRAVGLLLDGWLDRALGGRGPAEPPSARLAGAPRSAATRRLQARLAMNEPDYLRALREALASRRAVVS